MLVSHLTIHIKSMDIVLVFLESTCFFQSIYVIVTPVRLIVVAIVFPNGGCDFFPSTEPMFVRLPPFNRISFTKLANVGQPLYFVAGL